MPAAATSASIDVHHMQLTAQQAPAVMHYIESQITAAHSTAAQALAHRRILRQNVFLGTLLLSVAVSMLLPAEMIPSEQIIMGFGAMIVSAILGVVMIDIECRMESEDAHASVADLSGIWSKLAVDDSPPAEVLFTPPSKRHSMIIRIRNIVVHSLSAIAFYVFLFSLTAVVGFSTIERAPTLIRLLDGSASSAKTKTTDEAEARSSAAKSSKKASSKPVRNRPS
jgi:hypothetical protein